MIRLSKFLFPALLMLICNASWAECFCNESKNWKAAAMKKQYVFSGTITKKSSDTAHLIVNEVYKGDIPKELILYYLGGDCDQRPGEFNFQTQYLFAVDTIERTSTESRFQASACNRAIEAEKSKEVVKWLNSKMFKNLKPTMPDQLESKNK